MWSNWCSGHDHDALGGELDTQVAKKFPVLSAILLNPPLRPSEETISYQNVSAALPVTGCHRLCLANLLLVPSKDLPSLNKITVSEEVVVASRDALRKAIAESDEVLLAWGMGGVNGALRHVLNRQVGFVGSLLLERGIGRVWTLAGMPRHPSRWRQYLGPQRNRVSGHSFHDRLNSTLIPLTLDLPQGRSLIEDPF